MHRHLAISAALVAAASLSAQTFVTPPGYATTDGNSSSSYPWARGNSFIRIQYVYDASAFTTQGITSPVRLDGFRWRANGSSSVTTGGTYAGVAIDLSTSVNDYLSMSSTFDSNHGIDRVSVFTGSVTVADTAGTTPNNWYVDVDFTTPFVYDPSTGNDLLIDITIPASSYTASGSSSSPGSVDLVTGTAALATRLYSLSSSSSATASTTSTNQAAVIDWKIAGFAQKSLYGAGCYDRRISLYEYWASGPTDLGTSTGTNSILFTPNGSGGYVAHNGSGTFYTPTTADLALADDGLSAQTLPFTFPFPGGSTTSIGVCSNGFVWLDGSATSTDYSPSVAELLAQPARLCPQWGDLDPAEIDPTTNLPYGSVHFDVVTASNEAVVTWLHVPMYDSSTTNPRKPNTFQVVLRQDGSFEFRWQDCQSTNALLVGCSEGNGANDPGPVDLSTALTGSIDSGPRMLPLLLDASARPLIGTTINLLVDNLPANSPLGVLLLSFTQFDPGVDLTPVGMPGCFQYVGLDFPMIFTPSGTSYSRPLPIPNTPSLSGLEVFSQAAAMAAGANPLGVVNSNGLDLVLGVN